MTSNLEQVLELHNANQPANDLQSAINAYVAKLPEDQQFRAMRLLAGNARTIQDLFEAQRPVLEKQYQDAYAQAQANQQAYLQTLSANLTAANQAPQTPEGQLRIETQQAQANNRLKQALDAQLAAGTIGKSDYDLALNQGAPTQDQLVREAIARGAAAINEAATAPLRPFQMFIKQFSFEDFINQQDAVGNPRRASQYANPVLQREAGVA